MDESRGNKDDFYVFSARSGEEQNTVEMLIEAHNVIIDSGANCNLMSEGVFEFVTQANRKAALKAKFPKVFGEAERLSIKAPHR